MKKISELVKLREHITEVYSTDPVSQQLNKLEHALTVAGNETPMKDFANDIADLVQDLNNLHKKLEFNNQIEKYLIEKLDREISEESTKFLTDNYSLELRVESEAVENIRKVRAITLGPDIEQEILGRIRLHTDWKYPALEIGCRDGEWTNHLIASDPLYIADHYRDFLDSTKATFTDEYQRRVRAYLIKDTDLSALPQGQFGFVFCWNFLNYRSLDTVKEYLKSVKDILRPGGVFMFSYNNGDMHECAGYAEGHWMSFIPKRMLVPMCESLGYTVIHTRESRGDGTSISWIEIKRAGELQTAKAHQVLGEIKLIET